MKIVVITPILYDAKSPFNHLFKDILEGWLNAGHEIVRIVACEDLKDDAYKMGIVSERISYIPICRKKVDKSNIIIRFLRDTWTNIRMAKKLKKVTGAQLLFEDVSYSSYWSIRAAKKKKLHIVSMLQDVWPDNAVASELIKGGGIVYKFFEYWQKKVYKKSDRLICISDDMKLFITNKGVPSEKISIIYNWGYTDEIVDILWEDNEFVKKYDFPKEDFYAVYAGNIGKMQNIELIVEAAKRLNNEEKIKFLIVGDGVNKEKINDLIKTQSLDNVVLLPMQLPEFATHIYSMASVNIIPLVEGGVETALPSKTGIVLSCGKPTIFCFGDKSAFGLIASQYNGINNIGVKTEDALVENILSLYNAKKVNTDGVRQLFLEKFTREENIRKYVACLEFNN